MDSLGNLIKFRLIPSQYHDLVETKPLIEDVDFQTLLADKEFNADWLIQELNECKVKVVITPESNRKVAGLLISLCINGVISLKTISVS